MSVKSTMAIQQFDKGNGPWGLSFSKSISTMFSCVRISGPPRCSIYQQHAFAPGGGNRLKSLQLHEEVGLSLQVQPGNPGPAGLAFQLQDFILQDDVFH